MEYRIVKYSIIITENIENNIILVNNMILSHRQNNIKEKKTKKSMYIDGFLFIKE